MNIHEYQAKAVLKDFGVPVSKGVALLKPDEAEAAAFERHPGPLAHHVDYPRISRSLSSGAHSRDPLAHAGYGAD